MAKVKTCILNILETGVVTIAEGVEDTDFPKWRLWDRNVGDLSKWKTGFTLKVYQATPVAVNAFCLAEGHGLNDTVITISYSSDGVTYYTALSFTVNGPGVINQTFTEQTKAYWKIKVQAFKIETVRAGFTTYNYSGIVFDADNGAHLVCWEESNVILLYFYKPSGGSWTAAQSLGTATWLQYCGIAVDSNGKAHISYYKDSKLYYATNVTGSWVSEIVDSTVANQGQYSKIAIDSAGVCHISYLDVTNKDLRYAWGNAGSWNKHTIDSTVDVGYYTDIAIDSNNVVHISYHDATNLDLKYAYGNTTSWAVEIVDSVNSVGQYTSIAIDSNDVVHISYYDITNLDLKYAYGNTGSWTKSTVDSSGTVGEHTCIAIDSNDKCHISYYDNTNTNLKYASNATGAWLIDTIDSSGSVGKYTGIAVDNNDNVAISYHDATGNKTQYAFLSLPQLTEMFLTSLYEFEENPSLPTGPLDNVFNVENHVESGGSDRFIKHGPVKKQRNYNLYKIDDAQAANLTVLNDAWDGCNPFFFCDHNGVWIFCKLTQPISLRLEDENESDGLHSAILSILEVV